MTSDAPGATPRASHNRSETAAKDALRHAARRARAERRSTSGAVTDAARLPHLLALAEGHAVVACHLSLPPEPDSWALVEELAARGVRVLLPVLHRRRTPAWGWWAGRSGLVKGFRGIPEPADEARGPAGDALGPDALRAASLVVTTALLATPAGFRLGTGGGWYDRALAFRAPDAVTAAVLDSAEVVDALPVDPWDVPVDALVTEAGVRWTRAARAARATRAGNSNGPSKR